MDEDIKIQKSGFIPAVFIVSLICTGLFYEYASCAFSVLLLGWLLFKYQKVRTLRFQWNLTSLAVIALTLSYGISTMWAVDSGMAFIGALKFLPIFLFLLAVMQEQECKERIIEILPYAAAIMAIMSIAGMQISLLKPYFAVAGRLAGFFQYPNSFALFLLVAELLLITKRAYKGIDYITFAVLAGSILYTGSRTVFVLTVLSNIVMILVDKRKYVRIFGILIVVAMTIGVVLFALFSDEVYVVTRLLKLSLEESTFIGRILYAVDALPVILKHPFGLGYMGYYYIQQSIQTGVYSVQSVHNDFLQIMLDVGWVPFFLFIAAIVKSVFSKQINLDKKIILIVMVIHSCFDFDFQFVSMFCLFLLFLDWESGKEVVFEKRRIEMQISLAVLLCVCLYCGISLAFAQAGKYDIALSMYPWNTQAETILLTKIEDTEQACIVADRILSRNEYVTLAYSVKARQAYSEGDFENVITYKRELLEKAPFQYDEYEEYCYMLAHGISLYTKAGDEQSAKICQRELIETRDKLHHTDEYLSWLGKKIKDQPITELPKEMETYVDRLEKAK